MNENTILRTVPAANDLHKVPGFDPMKYLRKAVNEKGEPVMRLEPRYQRLWFRLACPKGRMLLNPLRVTDQMAIFEAKVFFHREDAAPASSFTATKTAQETAGYIRAAQDEALTVALDNAGFGIQLCDVTHGPGDGKCSPPAPPVQEHGSVQEAPPAQVQTEQTQEQKTPAGQGPGRCPPAPEPVPVAQSAPDPKPVPTVRPAEPVQTADASTVENVSEPAPTAQSAPAADPAPTVQPDPAPMAESQPVQEARQEALDAEPHEDPAPSAGQQSAPVTVLNFPVQRDEAATTQEDETPVSTQDQAETPPPAAPSYTDDMSVEEICQVMTLEEASAIVVPSGPNKGSTMAQLAERRPSSLRFFMTPFYKCSNSQKAAATLLIQELDQKIAG